MFFTVLLIGYWAAMTFIPVPGVGVGNFEPGLNLANYIDSQYLPLRKWNGDWDPEGLLSTLPAIATSLLGMFTGVFLKRENITLQRKVFWLAGAGVVLAGVGYLWNIYFPIIKQIWTSSYVLVAGGYSLLMLAVFFQIAEVWNWVKGFSPFLWLGSNAIALYLICGFINFYDFANVLIGGPVQEYIFGHFGELALSTVSFGLVLWLAWFMYKKKVFIKI
jgi:predicted acyltransferase